MSLFCLAHYVAILWTFCTYELHMSESVKIVAVKNSVKFIEKSTATIKWIASGLDYSVTMNCEKRLKGNSAVYAIATGKIDSKTRKLEFKMADVLHDKKIVMKTNIMKTNQTMIKLIIENTSYNDSSTITCKSNDNKSQSAVSLLVYKKLYEKQLIPLVVTVSKLNTFQNLSTVLCAFPKPRVTIERNRVTTTIEGQETQTNCFLYNFPPFLLLSQKQCGEMLKLTYHGVLNTIQKNIKLKLNLQVEPPSSAQIFRKNKGCIVVTWIGPNIGSCVEPTLTYEVILKKNSGYRGFNTSSNILEICDDFNTVKVRSRMKNTSSEWIEATSNLQSEVNSKDIQAIVITCTCVIVFFLVLILLYCCYINKFYTKMLRHCKKSSKKDTLLPKGNDFELREVSTSDEPSKTESRFRKISRKLSVETSGTLGRDDTQQNDNLNNKQKLEVSDEPAYPTKYPTNSLQRNIERERKKLEEEKKLHEDAERKYHDEFFLPTTRRHTDPNVLQDLRDYNLIATTNGQTYDLLPRLSQSTGSTGRSTYGEEDYNLLPRRNTDSCILRDSGNNSILTKPRIVDGENLPVYDIVPRTQSQQSSSAHNSHHSTEASDRDSLVYDLVPPPRARMMQEPTRAKYEQPTSRPRNNKQYENNEIIIQQKHFKQQKTGVAPSYDFISNRFNSNETVKQTPTSTEGQQQMYQQPQNPIHEDNVYDVLIGNDRNQTNETGNQASNDGLQFDNQINGEMQFAPFMTHKSKVATNYNTKLA